MWLILLLSADAVVPPPPPAACSCPNHCCSSPPLSLASVNGNKQGVTMPEDTCQGRRLVDKVVTYMNKYVDFFANLCQQDYQFQRYKPSHIAAAAILAARRALCIK